MLKPKQRLLKILLPVLLILGALGSGSCGGGSDYSPSDDDDCDLTSQRDEQRRSGEKREDYYPMIFSRDFSRDYPGTDISPSQDDYDTARKVSRSVFEIEFIRRGNSRGIGTGWLVAPRYVVTAAHAVRNIPGKKIVKIVIHTFDGDTIEAEKVVYHDPKQERGSDLALLRLLRKIDAVPLKIAQENPGKNDFLMAMGGGGILNGLGGWTVSAGPALELKSEYQPCPVMDFRGSGDTDCRERIYHAVPTAGGMSGGPIFNRRGEVVSIVSAGRLTSTDTMVDGFGIMPFQIPKEPPRTPENLWVYAFDQPKPNSFSYGPNPEELKEVVGRIPLGEQADNADDYGDNIWRAGHEFGNEYSPFPLDQFDDMQNVYKKAREATVSIRIHSGGEGALFALYGSGFIYDNNTVITAGHVAPNPGDKATITTIEGEDLHGRVLKTQDQTGKAEGCDIAVIEMNEADALSEYPKLEIADSPSSQCGDPLVSIGSADAYNSVGPLQGVGIVYRRTGTYVSQFISHSIVSGMSGGPIVNRDGQVISLNSTGFGKAVREEEKWIEPAPLHIRTRLPIYKAEYFFEGPRAETMERFVEEVEYYCPPR